MGFAHPLRSHPTTGLILIFAACAATIARANEAESRNRLLFVKKTPTDMDFITGRSFMSFGKRAADDPEFGRQFMPFGKRSSAAFDADSSHVAVWPMAYEKKAPSFQRDFLHFGKRDSGSAEGFERNFMAFGRKRAPANDFARDFMAFGRKRRK